MPAYWWFQRHTSRVAATNTSRAPAVYATPGRIAPHQAPAAESQRPSRRILATTGTQSGTIQTRHGGMIAVPQRTLS